MKRTVKTYLRLQLKKVLYVSAHDLSEGGLAVALAESLFKGQGLGAQVNVTGDATVALFSESQSRFLVTVKAENKEQFENLWTEASQIGSVTNDGKLTVSVNGELSLRIPLMNFINFGVKRFLR